MPNLKKRYIVIKSGKVVFSTDDAYRASQAATILKRKHPQTLIQLGERSTTLSKAILPHARKNPDSGMSSLIILAAVAGGAFALYEYLKKACVAGNAPTWLPISTCTFIGAGTQTPPPTTQPAATDTGTGSQAAQGVTVTLVNTSRPGQPFHVGDNWALSVSGHPNAPVVASSTQNGQPLAPANFGSTDANGRFTKTGQFDASTLGAWIETWTVGGVPAAPLVFTVLAQGVSGFEAGISHRASNLIPAGLVHAGGGFTMRRAW